MRGERKSPVRLWTSVQGCENALRKLRTLYGKSACSGQFRLQHYSLPSSPASTQSKKPSDKYDRGDCRPRYVLLFGVVTSIMRNDLWPGHRRGLTKMLCYIDTTKHLFVLQEDLIDTRPMRPDSNLCSLRCFLAAQSTHSFLLFPS